MAGKRTDVYYQAPGEDGWRLVEAAASRRVGRAEVRALLVAADADLRKTILAKEGAAEDAREFERSMARAMGAWGRVASVEARRLMDGAEAVVEKLARRFRGE